MRAPLLFILSFAITALARADGDYTHRYSSSGGNSYVYSGAASGLPGTCTDSTLAYATDATSGQNVKICVSNTWYTVGDGSGTGTPGGSNGDIQTNSAGSFGALTPGAGVSTALAADANAAAGLVTGNGTATLTNKTLTAPVLGGTVTGTYTLGGTPTFPSTVVSTTGTQTLTNKTLTAPVISSISNTGTVTLPTSTDTLVGKATTDTLTNKTLTAPVLSGTVTGTYTIGGTPTFPSSVATLTGTQTLTNKTLTSPTIGTKINLPRVTALPGTPSAGDTVIVTDDSAVGACDSAAGSSTSLCQYNGSAWVAIGDGGSGGSMVYPGAGISVSTGSAWSTSLTASGTGTKAVTGTGTYTSGNAVVIDANGNVVDAGSTQVDSGTLTNGDLCKYNSTGPVVDCNTAAPSGTIVGTSDTQTLTNKTLTSPVIASISNTGTLTLPTSTDTLVGRATTDTLTNKTLTSPIIGTSMNVPHVTAFPGSPSAGDVVVVTDDSAIGACDSAAGSAVSMCYYTGAAWTAIGDGTSAGGTVTVSGTPSSGQAAEWTSSSAVQGVAVTGTGSYVKATSPTLTTPTIGVATATSVNKVAITAPATSATLTVANGKTLTASNTLTFTGTDSSSVAFGTGGTVLYSGGALGTPASGTLTNATGLPISTGVSGLGTGIATALAVNTGTAGAPAILIAAGTSALGTSAITSGSCATVVTTTATGVATTDAISWTPNADISAVTGYAPVTTGALIIYPYPSANNVNWKVCNPTASSITPGAVTLNWRVVR